MALLGVPVYMGDAPCSAVLLLATSSAAATATPGPAGAAPPDALLCMQEAVVRPAYSTYAYARVC